MKRLRWMIPALFLLLPALLSARTWVVQQNGTGDFTDIQQAVDAAGVGDTVLVGPGRYDTFHTIPDVPEDWRMVVGVQVDSLTIRGIDRDLAIIGPTEPYPAPRDTAREKTLHHPRSVPRLGWAQEDAGKRIYSYGIATGTVTWVRVENLTFENTDNGVSVYPAGEVRDCVCRHMHDAGIVGDKAYTLLVEDCEIEYAGTGIGVQAYGGGQQWVIIRRCVGDHVYEMIYTQQHPNVLVEDCSAVGGLVDVWGGHAVVRRCHSNQGPVGIAVGLDGSAEIYDCDLAPDQGYALYVTGSTVVGSGNVLHGSGRYPTVRFGDCFIELHDCHILHVNGQYSIQVGYHSGPADAIDLRNNYWGTASADSIAAWIWDGHDDPSVQTFVQYEPFSSVPIPARKQSWGGVKALFR